MAKQTKQNQIDELTRKVKELQDKELDLRCASIAANNSETYQKRLAEGYKADAEYYKAQLLQCSEAHTKRAVEREGQFMKTIDAISAEALKFGAEQQARGEAALKHLASKADLALAVEQTRSDTLVYAFEHLADKLTKG